MSLPTIPVVLIAENADQGCVICNESITAKSVMIGTMNDLIKREWHHNDCFFCKKVPRFFYRGRTRIDSMVLKYEHFSGVEKLSPSIQDSLKSDILRANLRLASDSALINAGIVLEEVDPIPSAKVVRGTAAFPSSNAVNSNLEFGKSDNRFISITHVDELE